MAGRDGAPPLVDLVAGPTTGGVILAFETARQLGVRSIFAEEVRDADGGTRREFRRGFHIEPGERVLLVDDILTTGGSLLAMIPAVEAMGGEIVECAVLVDRSGGHPTLTSPTTGRVYPLRSLWGLDLPTYEPGAATCPRCADGTPVYAPGSTGTASLTRGPNHPEHLPGLRPRADRGHDRGRRAAGRDAAARHRGTTMVQGVVIGVDSAGLTKVRGFTLRADDGRTLVFDLAELENAVEFPPGHLVEHQGLGSKVRVWYRDASGTLQAIRLEDAPAGADVPDRAVAASAGRRDRLDRGVHLGR